MLQQSGGSGSTSSSANGGRGSPSHTPRPVIIVLDEIDRLISRDAQDLYQLFTLPALAGETASRHIIPHTTHTHCVRTVLPLTHLLDMKPFPGSDHACRTLGHRVEQTLLWGTVPASSAHASVCPEPVPCLLCVTVCTSRPPHTRSEESVGERSRQGPNCPCSPWPMGSHVMPTSHRAGALISDHEFGTADRPGVMQRPSAGKSSLYLHFLTQTDVTGSTRPAGLAESKTHCQDWLHGSSPRTPAGI